MAAVLLLVLVGVTPSAGAEDRRYADGCADLIAGIALGPFPPEVGLAHLFYVSEGQENPTFNVRFEGFDCGYPLEVRADYFDTLGSATEPGDYTVSGDTTPPVSGDSGPHPPTRSIPFTVNGSDAGQTDPVAESFTISLRDAKGGTIQHPSSAAVAVVDQHGTSRVGFADVALSQSETYVDVKIPVFRAGPADAPAQVSYDLLPGPSNPATPGSDFAPASGTVSFEGGGDRVSVIEFRITDDRDPESAEQVTVELRDPVDTAVAGSTVFTIADNEETIAPRSRFHHPRQGLRYTRGDFRLREMHVFTSDQGGSSVVRADLALRKNLGKGRCRWWTGKRWKGDRCASVRWLNLPSYDHDFFYYRIVSLRPSVGTKVRSYTAFARAIDGAGNVESAFERGRNANTFEVTKEKQKPSR